MGGQVNPYNVVMPGLDPGIHSGTFVLATALREWIAGSSPAMTTLKAAQFEDPETSRRILARTA
jgi:hypothetical protein